MLSKTQQVWRHLVTEAIEHRRRRWPSVTELARELDLGVSTAHRALELPVEIGTLQVRPSGGVRVLDPGRLLVLWAGQRAFGRDVVARFEVSVPATMVERSMTNVDAVLGGFGAAVARMGGNSIADYETVLVYGEPDVTLPPGDVRDGRITEVIVLEADPLLRRYAPVTSLCQAWVDLFNLPGWQAARYVHHLLPRLVSDAVTEQGLLSA